MYILIAIASLLLQACMESIDKIAIVKDKAIDLFAASFWRNLLFFVWIAIFAVTGLFGKFVFLITWPVILLGIIFTGSAFFIPISLKRLR